MNKLSFYRSAIKNLGAIATAKTQIKKHFGASETRLTSRMLKYPVLARRGTSDFNVFHQIFSCNEYRCVPDIAGLVIDLGANVGYSSAYFLSRFPDCFVIAVEPDPANYAVLVENLKPYIGRHQTIQAAVWPCREKLCFEQGSTLRGAEWGRRVQKAQIGESSIDAITVPDLIQLGGSQHVALLKIDIEGAETELFKAGSQEWLDRTDNIVIELHGEAASETFHNAIKTHMFSISTCDELTVCARR